MNPSWPEWEFLQEILELGEGQRDTTYLNFSPTAGSFLPENNGHDRDIENEEETRYILPMTPLCSKSSSSSLASSDVPSPTRFLAFSPLQRPTNDGSLQLFQSNRDKIPKLSRELRSGISRFPLQRTVLRGQDEDPFTVCKILGNGSQGSVEEVRSAHGSATACYVRKRVQLPVRQSQITSVLRRIREEVRNLKLAEHPHVVSIIGAYQDARCRYRQFYYLLMSPVGDNDLKTFLELVRDPAASVDDNSTRQWRQWIRRWFVCLSSALAYMHEHGIRHQDIKPSNIVHRGGEIFFTDFGSASSFDIGHTTSTENPCRSSMTYAAPEVADMLMKMEMDRHGCGSDIFSLGCVFCEMFTVLTGRTVSSFHSGPTRNGSRRASFWYSRELSYISQWFQGLPFFHWCILPMLRFERRLRPTATEVVTYIVHAQTWSTGCDCIKMVSVFMDANLDDIGVSIKD